MRKPILVPAVAALLLLTSCGKKSSDPVAPAPVRSYGVRVLKPGAATLVGADVMLQTQGQNFVATTDTTGFADLRIPDSVTLPASVVIIANQSSIMPEARTCPGAASASCSPVLAALPAPRFTLVRDPLLHHLGNDQLDTEPNSYFQLPAEGVQRQYTFQLFFVPSGSPMFRVFACGVMHPVEIYINGVLVNTLSMSARDGSLTTYSFQIVPFLLHYGQNTLTIKAVQNDLSDPYDDFEYCGLMLYYN